MNEIPLNYETAYNWTGNAESGEISIAGLPVLAIGSPHNLDRYSPEHLLVVAAEACLANTFLLIASMSKIEINNYSSNAEGELTGDSMTGYQFTRITIRPVITVEAKKTELTERILEKAHKLCMVSRALNIPVEIESSIEVV